MSLISPTPWIRTDVTGRRISAFLLTALLGLAGAKAEAQGGRSFPDLLLGEPRSTLLGYNRGDGTFMVRDLQLDDVDGAAIGDFDGDGDRDFAILTGLVLGHGDFTWYLLRFCWPDVQLCRVTQNSLEFADMDADGLTDVVLGCLDTVIIYYGTGGDPVLERGTVLRSGASYREDNEGPTVLLVGDLNEDGLPDLKAGQTSFGTQLFLNRGARSYEPSSKDFPEGHALRAHTHVERWMDFDGDGHLDVLYSFRPTFQEPRFGIHVGDGKLAFSNRSFEFPEWLLRNYNLADFEVADIDRDGSLDIVLLHGKLTDELPAEVNVLLGDGDGGIREARRLFELPPAFELSDGTSDRVNPTDMAVDDLNGDGWVDIAMVNPRASSTDGHIAEGTLWIVDGAGAGAFSAPRVLAAGAASKRIFSMGNVDRNFLRGDASDDGTLDITDAVVILLALFHGKDVSCGQALDADDDAVINITDAVYVLLHLFSTGAPPPSPYPEPGIDLTDTFPEDEDARSPGCSPEAWRYFREHR